VTHRFTLRGKRRGRSDEVRAVVEEELPELEYKLPRKT
jgi:hypothetical protein